MRFVDKEINPKQLSPLNLAFIGDCVYEMLVRETLVANANRPVNDLHQESVKYVSAKAQTEAFEKIKEKMINGGFTWQNDSEDMIDKETGEMEKAAQFVIARSEIEWQA